MNIVEKISEYLQSQRKSFQPSGNYASSAGHPCERHLVYQRLNWSEKLLPNVRTLLIFREGNLHEKAVIQLLTEAGIDVIETQRPFEIKEIQLRGRIDGQIKMEGKKYPAEIKSMNPFDWEKIGSLEDMRNSTKVWIRGYVTTMMVYLLGMNEEDGIFILKNKVSGELKFVFCRIDYELAEREWKKLERVNVHVAAGTYPERIEDRSVCKHCDFRHVCLPDEESEVLNIMEDDELVTMLDRHEALRAAAKEYEELDDTLKERWWKKTAVGTYLIAGRFQVKLSEYMRTFYKVPKEIQEHYKEKIPTVKANITELK